MAASVLVVDDDADIRTALADILRDEGFHVREAANGLDALIEVAEREPSVVILDLMMPAMNGWHVLAMLRRHRPALQVIILSALPVHGCADYVQKPISIHKLLELLAAVRQRAQGMA